MQGEHTLYFNDASVAEPNWQPCKCADRLAFSLKGGLGLATIEVTFEAVQPKDRASFIAINRIAKTGKPVELALSEGQLGKRGNQWLRATFVVQRSRVIKRRNGRSATFMAVLTYEDDSGILSEPSWNID